MFDLSHMTEVLGLWYLAYDDKDWLCLVWRETPIGGWTIRYRVRYYDPREPDAWSGVDRKSWFNADSPVTLSREALIANMRSLVAQLREQWPQATRVADELLVEGDGMALAQAMRGRAWVHSKTGADAKAWSRAFDIDQLPAQRRRATRLKGRRHGRR